MAEREVFLFKILLLGDSGVGKSCLMRCFVDNQYDDAYIATIGVDFRIKTITVDDILIKLQIWDTAGQERFQSITHTYYRGSDGAFLVVDMTNLQTLRDLPRTWMSDVRTYSGPEKEPVVIVLANKCDLTNELHITDGHLSNLLLTHFKTSAKKSINVQKAFEEMARQILKKRATEYRAHSLKGDTDKSPLLYKRNTAVKLNQGEKEDNNDKDGGCLC